MTNVYLIGLKVLYIFPCQSMYCIGIIAKETTHMLTAS